MDRHFVSSTSNIYKTFSTISVCLHSFQLHFSDKLWVWFTHVYCLVRCRPFCVASLDALNLYRGLILWIERLGRHWPSALLARLNREQAYACAFNKTNSIALLRQDDVACSCLWNELCSLLVLVGSCNVPSMSASTGLQEYHFSKFHMLYTKQGSIDGMLHSYSAWQPCISHNQVMKSPPPQPISLCLVFLLCSGAAFDLWNWGWQA